MNEYETIIGYYFKSILNLEQCRSKMYHKEDIYNRVPQLVYRLSRENNQEVYDAIKECIESFEGNLKWTEFKGFLGEKVFNHSISPLELYVMQKMNYEANNYVSEQVFFGLKEFQILCEKAIDDIPFLYEHIRRCLPNKLKKLNM